MKHYPKMRKSSNYFSMFFFSKSLKMIIFYFGDLSLLVRFWTFIWSLSYLFFLLNFKEFRDILREPKTNYWAIVVLCSIVFNFILSLRRLLVISASPICLAKSLADDLAWLYILCFHVVIQENIWMKNMFLE